MKPLDWITQLARWCCSKPKKATTVTPVQPSSYGITADPLLLTFTVAAATLTVAGNAPTDYSLTAEPVNLVFTVADAYLAAAGSEVLTADPVNLTFTVAPANLVAHLQMRADPVNLAFTVAPATLTTNPVLIAGAMDLTFTVAPADLRWLSGGYQQSVVDAGLTAVWDLRSTAGYNTVPGKRIGVNASPTNVSYSAGIIRTDGNATFGDGWIIDKPLYNQAAGTYTVNLTEFLFQTAPSIDWDVRNGKTDGSNAVTLNLTDGTVDLSGKGVDGDAFESYKNSTINLTRVAILDSPARAITQLNGGTWTDVYIRGLGYNCSANAHLEQIFVSGGVSNLTRVFCDMSVGQIGGPGAPENGGSAGLSGVIFFGGAEDPADWGLTTTLNITDSIIIGAARYGGNFTIQYRNDAGNLNLNLTNCVLQKGTSGYLGQGPVGTNSPTVVVASGCRDFDTGVNIDSLLNT